MTNLELVQTIYAAFGRGDIPAIVSTQAPDVVWSIAGKAPYSGTYRGTDAVMAFFQSLVENAEIVEFAPERFITSSDAVVVLGRERMRAKSTQRG